ncbi:hypothetical protein [Clostridium hydrogenum]|uniref:hypothetical protein n=1 Tax=Clostridium hydrogenum TaxID=2855764 RepID=UPI001F1F8267|nr:hypothetical protein [Clostridium hydrogenum]
MGKKLKIAFLIIVAIITILCSCINNIQLNRNIYCNDMHIKRSEQEEMNRLNNYNLDDMEKHLDYLEHKENETDKEESSSNAIDVLEKVYVPKFRILFSDNPIDLRFETANYKIYINNKILDTIDGKCNNIYDTCALCINDMNRCIDEVGKDISAFKGKIYQYLGVN